MKSPISPTIDAPSLAGRRAAMRLLIGAALAGPVIALAACSGDLRGPRPTGPNGENYGGANRDR